MAFDVLSLDGEPSTALPYRERRALLKGLCLEGATWRAPDPQAGGRGGCQNRRECRRAAPLRSPPPSARAGPRRRDGPTSPTRARRARGIGSAASRRCAWAERHGTAPRAYEWSPDHGRALGLLPGDRLVEWERSHPRFPSADTVRRHCGSWREALRATGLAEAPAREPELPLAERVAAARRLRSDGVSTAQIADLLAVDRSTIALGRDSLRPGLLRLALGFVTGIAADEHRTEKDPYDGNAVLSPSHRLAPWLAPPIRLWTPLGSYPRGCDTPRSGRGPVMRISGAGGQPP